MTRGAHFTPGIRGQTVELLQTDKQRSLLAAPTTGSIFAWGLTK